MTNDQIKDEVKRAVLVSDVLAMKGIAVNRSGQFSSPFREDKHPSCSWKKSSNTWKDFTTGEGGDAIQLYMQLFGLDFMSALRELAAKINIELNQLPTNTRPTPPIKAPKRTFGSLLDKALVDAFSEDEAEWYFTKLGNCYSYDDDYEIELASTEENGILAVMKQLKNQLKRERVKCNSKIFEDLYRYCSLPENVNKKAMDYLTVERNLSIDALKEFKIFTIGNYSKVNEHLKKTFDIKELQRSGLFNEKEDGSGNFIFYNHRILIPYQYKGHIVYLRGRYFDAFGRSKNDTKYIGLRNDALGVNTPKRFFNVDLIEKLLVGEEFYITEGEFDAMALHTLGYDALAIPGVHNIPSENWFNAMRYSVPILCMDDDEAGDGLKEVLVKTFNGLKVPVYCKQLPNGAVDVNEFLMEN